MRKKLTSQSGLFNPRTLLAFLLCSLGASFGWLSFASNPTSTNVTPTSSPMTWVGTAPGPATAPVDAETSCVDGVNCDTFIINLSGVKSDWANKQVHVSIDWTDATGATDYDLYIHKGTTAGTTVGESAGSDNPEAANINPNEPSLDVGTGQFTVHVIYYTATAANQYTGHVSIIDAPPPSAAPPPLSSPPPAAPGVPRYYNYSPGPGVGETAGEPTIGFNLTTKHAMYISGLQTLRVTFPDTGACDATWEDVSYVLTSKKSLDPILWTDQAIGRTFVSQLDSVVPPASPVLIGLNSLMAYTDDDGQNWTPAQLNPPDGSYDHQNVGSGPYPASLDPVLGNAVNKHRAVYYCSQAGVTAFCSRSDDGGLNFGPSRNPYSTVDGCSAIHGHVKVAPDGTVYLPTRSCGSDPNVFQSVARSTDAGETWTIHQVKGPGFTGAKPPPGILDPSIAIASDGTLYFAYISSEIDGGHARVAVSHDKAATWGNDFDIGASYGLPNAVFATAIAGDPNRAAVGFLGTTAPGNHQGPTFAGTWYVFVAHTYDGGASWTTVNATPDDPVQKESCIWNQGGSNPCRNLLDFTGITKDDKGRVLYGYADGCIGDCVSGGPNSYSSKATIAKQSGGKSLLSTFDPAEPILPQSACLSGRRDDLGSYLKWKSPDNGGSDIQYYRIFRGETIGTMSEVGTASGKKLSFTDRSADPAVANYFYLIYAHNAQGDGAASNVIQLPLGQRLEPIQACSRPGVEVLQDPVGDATTQLMQHDITSVSIAEPENQSGKLVFVIKVRNLSPVPPNWRWAVRFNTKLAPPVVPGVGAQDDWFVSFVSGAEGAADQYTYGSTGVFQGASRVFTTIGTLDPASTRTADGYIVLVLPKNLVGNLQPGDDVTNIFGSVRLNGPTGGTNETIPDSTGTGSYKTRTANLCLPNAAPLAALEANVDSGFKPLPVQFDASGSTDPDAIDTIGSYSFNFGDGTDDVVQDCASNPNCAVIDHTFNEAGLYAVKCVATDSRGKASSNIAQVLIEVDVPFTKVVSRKLHAGVPRDIELALSGPVTTEPRDSSAEHTLQLIFTFERDITNPGSATKSQGGGSIGQATIGPASNQVTVDLSNVTDQQHVVVTLNGVHDSQNAVLDNLPARVDVLAGDTNDDGRVNIQDTNQTKANSGYVLTNDTNARVDVVNDDGRINIADTNYVKARSGHVVLSGSSPTTGKATAERAK